MWYCEYTCDNSFLSLSLASFSHVTQSTSWEHPVTRVQHNISVAPHGGSGSGKTIQNPKYKPPQGPTWPLCCCHFHPALLHWIYFVLYNNHNVHNNVWNFTFKLSAIVTSDHLYIEWQKLNLLTRGNICEHLNANFQVCTSTKQISHILLHKDPFFWGVK